MDRKIGGHVMEVSFELILGHSHPELMYFQDIPLIYLTTLDRIYSSWMLWNMLNAAESGIARLLPAQSSRMSPWYMHA